MHAHELPPTKPSAAADGAPHMCIRYAQVVASGGDAAVLAFTMLAVFAHWTHAEPPTSSAGTLPQKWTGMLQLQHLSVSFNNIVGTLPPAWGQLGALPKLATLYL